MILFYGGKKYVKTIEYNLPYFENYKNIILFEKKLQKYNLDFKNNNDKNNDKNNNNYITINEIEDELNIILPNYINNYFIKINPHSYFNTLEVIDINNINNLLMIIFNHNNVPNLEVIINREINQNKNSIITCYFYNLKNKISITNIYDIYNNNDFIIYIAIFIMKKPYFY
jgi:hypothetical protein